MLALIWRPKGFNSSRTAVPFRRQATRIISSLSQKNGTVVVQKGSTSPTCPKCFGLKRVIPILASVAAAQMAVQTPFRHRAPNAPFGALFQDSFSTPCQAHAEIGSIPCGVGQQRIQHPAMPIRHRARFFSGRLPILFCEKTTPRQPNS